MAQHLGRPPLDRHDPSVPINVKVPSRLYDALYAQARQAHVSVPELIRRQVERRPDKRNLK